MNFIRYIYIYNFFFNETEKTQKIQNIIIRKIVIIFYIKLDKTFKSIKLLLCHSGDDDSEQKFLPTKSTLTIIRQCK